MCWKQQDYVKDYFDGPEWSRVYNYPPPPRVITGVVLNSDTCFPFTYTQTVTSDTSNHNINPNPQLRRSNRRGIIFDRGTEFNKTGGA